MLLFEMIDAAEQREENEKNQIEEEEKENELDDYSNADEVMFSID